MKKPITIALLIILVLLSFVRENFFLILNGAISQTNSYKANIEIPSFLNDDFTTSQLIAIKYAASVIFLILFILLTTALIKFIFEDRTKQITFLKIITIVTAFAGVILILFYTTKEYNLYLLFIRIIHFIQSPMPFFIALPLLNFSNRKSTY